MIDSARLPALGDRLDVGPLRVSPICLGLTQNARIVPAAFDAGVNFFFVTADMHWPYYEGTRKGLQDLLRRPGVSRDDIVVAGVSYVSQPEFSAAPLEELIAFLPGLQRVDLVIIGGTYRADFFARRISVGPLVGNARIGARALGATFHDRGGVLPALEARLVDIAFTRYNAQHRGAEEEIFDRLERPPRSALYTFKGAHGVVERARMTELGFGPDHWCPEPPDYYRFALRRPGPDGLLLSLFDEKELRELVDGLAKGPLDEEERVYMERLADVHLGRAEVVPDE